VSSPRIVIGMPLYNEKKYGPAAIESLLAQTYGDFTLAIVDDSTDGTSDIIADFARRDRRVVHHRLEKRVGAIEAFRLTHFVAGESDYFSWAGGHDLWHPQWLEKLLPAIHGHPKVVIAYGKTGAISATGEHLPDPSPEFDTVGMTPWQRATAMGLRIRGAGTMLMGLFRTPALRQAGVFRRFLVMDALLIQEMALLGEFRQVPEVLYYRRQVGLTTVRSPRNTLFSPLHPMPWYCNLPAWLPNSLFVAWRAVASRPEGADMGRLPGLTMAGLQLARGAGGAAAELVGLYPVASAFRRKIRK
jgi:glycosyltransferase involved in cell wall biosynthesis